MNEIVTKLTDPVFHQQLLLIKIGFIVISAVLFVLYYWLWWQNRWLRVNRWNRWKEWRHQRTIEETQFVKKWNAVKRKVRKGLEGEIKMAVLEADEMLDDLLDRLAYEGDDIEARLDKVADNVAATNISNWEELKQARMVRDMIIADPEVKIPSSDIRKAIKEYEDTFRDLNAI